MASELLRRAARKRSCDADSALACAKALNPARISVVFASCIGES
jgi:hypothetical protein